jgi:hypothetical protein
MRQLRVLLGTALAQLAFSVASMRQLAASFFLGRRVVVLHGFVVAVAEEVAWEKLRALRAGADLASQRTS